MDQLINYVEDDQLEQFKVPQLKAYLKRYGQFVSGKRDELVLRAKGVQILGLKTVDDNRSGDVRAGVVRKEEKLVTPLGEKIPKIDTLKGWSNDLSLVPDFSDSDVYNYLVLTMKAKRQLKSRVFFNDRHVHAVQYHPVNDDCSHCVVKCKVLPSLPTLNKKEHPDYDVWACLSKITGNVHSADNFLYLYSWVSF